eukprot:1620959-Prymnesium_polylepis.2
MTQALPPISLKRRSNCARAAWDSRQSRVTETNAAHMSHHSTKTLVASRAALQVDGSRDFARPEFIPSASTMRARTPRVPCMSRVLVV